MGKDQIGSFIFDITPTPFMIDLRNPDNGIKITDSKFCTDNTIGRGDSIATMTKSAANKISPQLVPSIVSSGIQVQKSLA